MADRIVIAPMTLSDLERREGQFFQADLLSKTHVPFDVERPNSQENTSGEGRTPFLAELPNLTW